MSNLVFHIFPNQWQELPREEQEIYYAKAKAAAKLHMELYPGWTAKDNYAINGKKKKKKRERNLDGGKCARDVRNENGANLSCCRILFQNAER